MVADTERNYRGTNFVVVTLIVLLVLVGGYFLVVHLNELQDEPATMPIGAMDDAARNPGVQ